MKVMILLIVIGDFGTVTKGLFKGLDDLEVGGRVVTIQTTVLLRKVRILRKVLETWGDLLSLKLQWNYIIPWELVFHWSLRENKSPQVSGTLLSILAVLGNAVVWMISTRPLFSKSSSPFNNPLVTVPRAPSTIGITVPQFFNSLTRPKYISFFSFSFNFILWSAGTAKSTILQVLFFPNPIGIKILWELLLLLFTPLEFFTPTLADGLSLETEWQQASSSLQDSSQYSSRSQ